MRARVWGSRGSLAAPGPDTLRYGGNTSCVEVRLESGHRVILDAGTGLRALGVLMDDEPVDELHILLTHLHLDHVQGLGFFRPLFKPGIDVHIWGPASPVQSLADRIAIYLSPPLFPVRLSDIPANLTFHDAPRRRRRHHRVGDGAGWQGRSPRPDRRIPHRGGRAVARLSPRS
jgi:phosphoribosyl 1,2-cyclic phosphodiesterase